MAVLTRDTETTFNDDFDTLDYSEDKYGAGVLRELPKEDICVSVSGAPPS